MANNNELNYDILIKAINVISYDGKTTQSIISQVSSIDIYESIFNALVSCDVQMIDQINLIETFPLLRQKVYLEMEYSTPKLEGSVKRRFIVNEIGLRTYDNQLKTSKYVLQCLSEEAIQHSNQVVTEAISGEEISKAVARIVKTYLKSNKKVSTDNTKGTQSIQVLNLKPLKAIDFLRKKAISKSYVSNTFLFFENVHGFHFVTLEWLINNIKGPADAKFFLKLGDDPSVARFRNILGYQGIVQDNATDIIASGGLHTVHKRLDIATGVVTEFVTKPNVEAFLRGAGVNVSPHLSTFITDNSKNPAITVYTVWDSTQGETFSYEQPLRDFYINLCTSNITRIHVYGDAALTCGDTVDLQLPVASSDVEDMKKVNYSKYMSGKFLISKIRHMISVQGNASFSYRMSLELIRPAYGETIL